MKKKLMIIVSLTIYHVAYAPCCNKSNVTVAPAPVRTQPSRSPDYPINLIFLERWSSRALSRESISEQELMSLFEAARWAPSAFNEQPWHFLYVTRDDPYWNDFLSLLDPFNQEWTKNAHVLVLILSRNFYERVGKPNPTHSFDAGAAWMSMTLQGHAMGISVHAISGFDYERARHDLHIPDCYTVDAMLAIGRKGKKEDLSEKLQAKEIISGRKKISEFITRGPFLTC